MKKFLVFLIILAAIAGGGYFWWTQNSKRIISDQVRQLAGRFFVNPDDISIKNSAVKVVGLRQARVDRLSISGKKLALKDGPVLAYAALELKNVEVTGPPFQLSKVESGSYQVKVTDKEVTRYLHSRGGSVAGVKVIPLNTLTVQFLEGDKAPVMIKGEAVIPIIGQRVPLTATGNLVPSTDSSKVDFRTKTVSFKGINIPIAKVKESLKVINPIVDLSHWPLDLDIDSIISKAGIVTIKGTVTGADDSIIPGL